MICCGAFICMTHSQRWSREHKARGQGQGNKKYPRPRTALLRTDTLEAKHRNARGQDQKPRTQKPSVLRKKRSSKKFFRQSPETKKFSKKFFRRSPKKKVFKIFFQAISIKNGPEKKSSADLQNFNHSKIVLSLSRGQGSFRGLEASRPRPRT